MNNAYALRYIVLGFQPERAITQFKYFIIMELEELRDALKMASAREYALVEELLVCVDKKKFD
ncbi:hypothetical protein [Bacteroides cellulosilyticus]|uniref:hypothetical protein n=1 Tax=Bacteroides cellulosilyticus TaxID=246787 RepID=UPI0032EC528A